MCERCSSVGVDRRTFLGGALAFGALPFVGRAQAPRQVPDRPLVTVADGLSIAPREAWAEAPPRWDIPPEDVRFLLVHHTAGPQPVAADVPDELRGIYRFHTGPEKNWPDVCYNFFIDPGGGVWEGRAGSLAGPVQADATGGSQGFAQLVCLLGDFTAVMPTQAASDSLVRTLTWLATRYGIDTDPTATVNFVSRGSNKWPVGSDVVAPTICGHRDMTRTACPGDTFYPYLMADLRQQVFAASPPPVPSPPSTTATTVAPTTTTTAVLPTHTSSSPTSSAVPAPDAMTEPMSSSSTSVPSTAASGPSGGSLTRSSSSRWVVVAGAGAVTLGGVALAARRHGRELPPTTREQTGSEQAT